MLSFDFDGTLHTPSEVPPVPAEFFEVIRQLRRDHAIVWGINTGRSLAQMEEGFAESAFPFLPDWLVAREREIYFPTASGRWQPHAEWNLAGEQQIADLFAESRHLLDAVRRLVEDHTGGQWLAFDGEPAGIISRTEEEMDWLVGKITTLVAGEPRLGWQHNSIYLRFGHRDFQKGSSLTEVARHHEVRAPQCFAIGDSHNDLTMLSPAHAGMAACPANAVAAVKTHVANRGGYVATAAHGAGVIESLRHFFGRGVKVDCRC